MNVERKGTRKEKGKSMHLLPSLPPSLSYPLPHSPLFLPSLPTPSLGASVENTLIGGGVGEVSRLGASVENTLIRRRGL